MAASKREPSGDPKIATRVAELRKNAKYTQEQLATAVGVKQPVVAGWESARDGISVPNLCKLADLFKVSLDLLVRGMEIDGRPDFELHLFKLLERLGPSRIWVALAAPVDELRDALDKFEVEYLRREREKLSDPE